MRRIITTRLPQYNLEAKHWLKESQDIWSLASINEVIVSHVFDFGEVSDDDFEVVCGVLASDLSTMRFNIPKDDVPYFHIKAVDGQFDDTLERTRKLVNNFSNIDTEVSHSLLFSFPKADQSDVDKFRTYFVNAYEYVMFDAKYMIEDTADEMNPIVGFIDMDSKELEAFKDQMAMDMDDLYVTQDYFKSINRNPSMTELKIIDTYWSDHCRHTTFLTHLDSLVIEDPRVQEAYESYLESRAKVYTDKAKPITLMDLATINAKEISMKGLLNDWDKSAEVNAISLNIDIEVKGKKEGWQLLFKNETHNHPTEIEPYGGASTCFGGCVRDPLSGRGMVYQGMRLSGTKSPLTSLEATRSGKLMARRICQEASDGYSDYSNQIGIKSGYAKEYYHDGFEAKRMELGALVAAVKQEYIQKSEPIAGDVVLLIGGRTGRDGLGAAVGSSKTQTKSSLLKAGAEVQKGDPIMEHKIVRLFRDPEVLRRIKRCNDFGAGGVSVAVGELADGLIIDLDQVATKYPMHGGEIALSESQERMAVVLDKHDVDVFVDLCKAQDLEARVIAHVTEEKVMKMVFKGKEIVSLDRYFLDSNGATKKTDVVIASMRAKLDTVAITKENLEKSVAVLENASQKGMREKFNSTVLYGNLHEGNDILQEGMVSVLPVSDTTAVSFMSAGYPLVFSEDPFKLGYMSVVEAVSRIVAMGGSPKQIRLSMQEYFERLTTKEQWGKPYAALLGAFSVMKAWDIPALGGKDSMSGSFESLHVPATLITFALQHGDKSHVITRNLKESGHKIVWIKPHEVDGLLDLEGLMDIYSQVYEANLNHKIYAASTITSSVFNSLFEMALGSVLGLDIVKDDALLSVNIGGLLLEVDEDFEMGEVIARTKVSPSIKVGPWSFDKKTLQESHENLLESVYPTIKLEDKEVVVDPSSSHFVKRSKKPTALVVMVQGVNGDFDVLHRLKEAGFDVVESVVCLMDYETSLYALKDAICKSDVVVLPHGNVRDNGVNDGGIEWQLIFSHPILDSVLHNYKGEIVGIGNGALGLVKLGLLGEVCIKPIGKHYYSSKVTIVNDGFPGLMGYKGHSLTIPMTLPYAITSYKGCISVLKQHQAPLDSDNTVGIASDNVIGILGSIDQVDSLFFANLRNYKMEEAI